MLDEQIGSIAWRYLNVRVLTTRFRTPPQVLRTRNIKTLVLDEADEMLAKNFKDQIYDIYRYLPPETQVVLVSATLPAEVLEMTTKFMTNPVRVLVKRDELTLEVGWTRVEGRLC